MANPWNVFLLDYLKEICRNFQIPLADHASKEAIVAMLAASGLELRDVLQRHIAALPQTNDAMLSSIRKQKFDFVAWDEKIPIDDYFDMFEKALNMRQIDKVCWPILLCEKLTGKALKAFQLLPAAQCDTYDTLKAGILEHFQINLEHYRKRFRASVKLDHETYVDYYHRIFNFAQKWFNISSADLNTPSVNNMFQAIVLERFLGSLNLTIRAAIKDKQPSTALEAARFTDAYVLNHTPNFNTQDNFRPNNYAHERQSKTITCFRCGKIGHFAQTCNSKTGN